MEEYKNGAISEEALEEVAGGLKMDKEKLKKTLALAGVGIVTAGLVGYGGYKLFGKKGEEQPAFVPLTTDNGIDSPDVKNY